VAEGEGNHAGAETPRAPRWRGRLIVALLVVVGVSVAGRVALSKESPETSRSTSPSGGPTTSLVPGDTPSGGEPEVQKEEGKAQTILPYVTEGGLAMLIGLLLGMATRGFLKLGLLLLVVAFVGLQYLAYKNILTVNWSALKEYVLNATHGADWMTVVKQKLPSGGAFGLGYLLGLKKG